MAAQRVIITLECTDLPGAQLLHDEEQAHERREAGAVEVLLALPQAHQITRKRSRSR